MARKATVNTARNKLRTTKRAKSARVKKTKIPKANTLGASVGNFKGANTLGASVGNFKGANIPTAQKFEGANIAAATDNTPLGEALDSTPEEGANIYDEAIGYGTALPGESGVDAVARIKAERAARRARVGFKQ